MNKGPIKVVSRPLNGSNNLVHEPPLRGVLGTLARFLPF